MMENSSYSRVSSAAEIENINTRRQVLQWLDMLRNTLLDIVGNGENPGNQIARGARQYVLENIESHVGLQEAADHLGVSAGYLSTIFKREYGQSFIDFINSTKIEYACRLLEEKELMVTEIACRLGYENAYYFSKVFRKYTGMSPTSYQKHVTEAE
ncbi:MAG: helix-turn-helix domain-containing protein [Marvinbryantia sp.]|uniref:helix-turn-helix domain-containing protein n=1 Tax=Marvinbryantia sp. TaxID=2496532 RepID=UPI002624A5AB|nr:AraC family transcriptional regulator [uncultured Marvinbryantia sp.]